MVWSAVRITLPFALRLLCLYCRQRRPQLGNWLPWLDDHAAAAHRAPQHQRRADQHHVIVDCGSSRREESRPQPMMGL